MTSPATLIKALLSQLAMTFLSNFAPFESFKHRISVITSPLSKAAQTHEYTLPFGSHDILA